MKDVRPKGRVKSLHLGRGRAVTPWDEAEDVCWLMAFSPTHATHERRDVYKYLAWLDSRDELLPTSDDYESLDDVPDDELLAELADASGGLYEEARANPGRAVTRPFGDGDVLMVIDVLVETEGDYEQGWYSVTFPATTPLAVEDVHEILAQLLPSNVDVDSLELASDLHGEGLGPCQVVWTWTCYPDV